MHQRTFYTSLLSALFLSVTSAHAQVELRELSYQHDGQTYLGYVAQNTRLEQPLGTVMIIHDWDGPNRYEQLRAEQLARMGYRAFAVDLFGRDRQPTSMAENRARTSELYADRDEFRARLQASLEQAQQLDPDADIVVMGYCFGGAASLEMARAGMDVQGYVSFHGGLDLPEGQDYSQTRAPVLVLHGSADPVSNMQDLAALLDDLQRSGVEHNAHIYGGTLHSFTVYSSQDYDLPADQASWHAFSQFLQQQIR